MKKHSRIKKTNQGIQAQINSKIQRNKVRRYKQEKIKKEVGKPRNLNNIKVDQPKIWSSKKQIVNIISFLLENGRHNSIHLAGAKRNSKNEQDEIKRKKKEDLYKQIKKEQPLLEFLEIVSIKYLGLPQKKQKKSRIIVFFFRNTISIKKYVPKESLQNTKWIKILKKFYFLLDEQFYQELIQILKQIENQFSIEQITNYLIEDFLFISNLKDIQVILKNLLIQIIKTGEDADLNMNALKDSSSDEMLEIYKKKIYFYQDKIMEFITELQDLFNNYDHKQQTQDPQYYQAQKNNYIEDDFEVNYVEENHLNSDPIIILGCKGTKS